MSPTISDALTRSNDAPRNGSAARVAADARRAPALRVSIAQRQVEAGTTDAPVDSSSGR